jgi:hypothetical protein
MFPSFVDLGFPAGTDATADFVHGEASCKRVAFRFHRHRYYHKSEAHDHGAATERSQAVYLRGRQYMGLHAPLLCVDNVFKVYLADMTLPVRPRLCPP